MTTWPKHPNWKGDDNEILVAAGMKPLDKSQLQKFNELWNAIFKIMGMLYCKSSFEYQAKHGNPFRKICSDTEQVKALEQAFSTADLTQSGVLNDQQFCVFLKSAMGAEDAWATDEILDLWSAACMSLHANNDQSANWEDFVHSTKIMDALYKSNKGETWRSFVADPKYFRQFLQEHEIERTATDKSRSSLGSALMRNY